MNTRQSLTVFWAW